MAATSKAKRAVGLSLAAAVAGSIALVPVANAQESATAKETAPVTSSAAVDPVSSTSNASSVSTTPATTPATANTPVADSAAPVTQTPAKDSSISDAAKAFAALFLDTPGNGTGTSGAQYNSKGRTYTALARHPENKLLYAISQDEEGKDAGHLLRINANDGGLMDLGKIDLKGDDATKIDTAAFTAGGTLVLFGEDKVYTLDLSDDKSGAKNTPLAFTTKPLKIDGVKEAGKPAAWAADGEKNETSLVALSTNDKGEAYLWHLDVDEKAPAATHAAVTVPEKATLPKVKALNYAYKNEDGEFVFADDDATAIHVKDNAVSNVVTKGDEADNFAGVAGLKLPGLDNPETGAATPTATPGSETPTNPATTTTPATETPTNSATTPTAPAAEDDWVMEVLVRTDDNKAVEGAEFKSADGRVAGRTGADGRANVVFDLNKDAKDRKLIKLTLIEPPHGYKNTEIQVQRNAKTAEIVLPRDPNVTTLNRPQQILKAIDEFKPIATKVLGPAAAMAGAASLAGAGGGAKTKKSSATPLPLKTTPSRSTGRTTSVKNASNNSNRVAAKGSTSTKKTTTSSSKERDGDLADTGTPMRAVISLGVLLMLVGGAYLALGRRRETNEN
ncbi:hypothetical protein SAMN04488531_1124 [Corynebacterium coyleae]|uniref:Gram-positive cocci surface proteins LPxTG domain-containing protein n=1 Tax=Corynebacterium coyleae TaxID=53374 RepID=A0ABX8L039_9CORY|nr:hypothetical protein [Corynebacterium coyleae]QXB19466.1 hypothetical protein I6L55_05255 [Corynebacterium coyleae]WJY78749.1 hypothetical protein CCOY_00560 [Corynebacterium coyleae]SEB56747.1 hypothetical protein SAMN04488531_1124 [Corynebacterium coyleae]